MIAGRTVSRSTRDVGRKKVRRPADMLGNSPWSAAIRMWCPGNQAIVKRPPTVARDNGVIETTATIEVADDTFVVSDRSSAACVVIRGAEPLIIGTGTPGAPALFELVQPEDVRWIFLSHAHPDHAGNALALLAACTQAAVVTTWLANEHLAAGGVVLPPWRCRLVDEGDVLDTGDRALVVERPPLQGFPSTVGLLDTSTSVYWSSECWSASFEGAPRVLDDEHLDEWRAAFVRFHHWHCPWVHTVDPAWWLRAVDRVAQRELAVIVPAAGPVVPRALVPMAVEALRELPMLPPAPPGAVASNQLL